VTGLVALAEYCLVKGVLTNVGTTQALAVMQEAGAVPEWLQGSISRSEEFDKGIMSIMEDPMLIVEGIAQSSSDAYEEKGIAYCVGFAGAEIAQMLVPWTKISKSAKVEKVVATTDKIVDAEKAVIKLEAGASKAESLDLRIWEECSVGGTYQLTPKGLRTAKVRDLKKIKSKMEANDIKLIIDKKGEILPDYAAGGFDYNKGEIVLRDNPSLLSLQHESFHAEQYAKIGKEKYLQQTVLAREEHVYSRIMKNKENFNIKEILEAQRYIYKLRNGEWPPNDWKGFTE
jgi:hypothetical protein